MIQVTFQLLHGGFAARAGHEVYGRMVVRALVPAASTRISTLGLYVGPHEPLAARLGYILLGLVADSLVA